MDQPDPQEQEQRQHTRTVAIVVGLALLFLAFTFTPLTPAHIMGWGESAADKPWAIALILITMAVMMSLGLPGSMCLWLIAPFHPPLTATLLLVAGSLAGALGGYALSSRLREAAPRTRIGQRIYKLLTERGDLLTQTALRMLPGFPHVIVNFSAGLLRLPLPTFIAATVIGLSIKWSVYCSAIYGARNAIQAESALDVSTLLPLGILGILVLISGQFRHLGNPKD